MLSWAEYRHSSALHIEKKKKDLRSMLRSWRGLAFIVLSQSWLLLKRFDSSRKQASSKYEKLGTSTRRIKGRRKKRGDTPSLFLSPSLPPLRAHHLRSEREKSGLVPHIKFQSFFFCNSVTCTHFSHVLNIPEVFFYISIHSSSINWVILLSSFHHNTMQRMLCWCRPRRGWLG